MSMRRASTSTSKERERQTGKGGGEEKRQRILTREKKRGFDFLKREGRDERRPVSQREAVAKDPRYEDDRARFTEIIKLAMTQTA